jgi:hypothetical protein
MPWQVGIYNVPATIAVPVIRPTGSAEAGRIANDARQFRQWAGCAGHVTDRAGFRTVGTAAMKRLAVGVRRKSKRDD